MSVYTDLLNSSDSLYTPIVWNTTTNAIPSVAASTSKITVQAVVFGSDGDTLPGANISINGIPKIQTNGNGFFSLYNVSPTDTIKISYIGQQDFEAKAASFPNSVEMRESAESLDEVVVRAAKKTNWLLPLGIVAIGFLAYRKYGKKATVKAKI